MHNLPYQFRKQSCNNFIVQLINDIQKASIQDLYDTYKKKMDLVLNIEMKMSSLKRFWIKSRTKSSFRYKKIQTNIF